MLIKFSNKDPELSLYCHFKPIFMVKLVFYLVNEAINILNLNEIKTTDVPETFTENIHCLLYFSVTQIICPDEGGQPDFIWQ